MAIPKRDQTHPLGPKARSVVQTTIEVRESPNGSCSILAVTTSDRPGLLVDVVSVLKDINVNVVSAEIDTIGDEARDEFFVTYHGEPLNGPMVQLVTNSLQVRRHGVQCWSFTRKMARHTRMCCEGLASRSAVTQPGPSGHH
jgi:UTP:GlnB (protein PII) uridylyltransferase